MRCFTDTGLSGDYAPGAYLQNFHGNTDVFAIRDEYGTLTGLNWSFPGLDIYDACTQVIARAYEAEGLPTPTAVSNAPLPERTRRLRALRPHRQRGRHAHPISARPCASSSTRRRAWNCAGDAGGVGAYAVRDANGELTGLRVATAEESAAGEDEMHEGDAPPQQGGPLGSVEAAEDWY